MEVTTLVSLALLGGITGLDSASCVQAMISRPIVAGPLAGLLLGDPVAGMWAGAILEILSLRQLPIGANRGWDTGPAAVAAVAAALRWTAGPIALLVGVGFGVVVGWVGSWSVHWMRQFNSRLVAVEGQPLDTPSRLTVRHLSAVFVDLFRATALTAAAVACITLLATALADAAAGLANVVAGLLLLAFASLALGVDLRMMARGRRVWTAAGVGAVLGVILAIWLR
ncbi:MAG: PTS sugar transporter subunit IIC [Gemmatimonadota bacterium]|nr:MAG: PTS sugar transporter subunit IIC [Gemmatimonadota bacterium]